MTELNAPMVILLIQIIFIYIPVAWFLWCDRRGGGTGGAGPSMPGGGVDD